MIVHKKNKIVREYRKRKLSRDRSIRRKEGAQQIMKKKRVTAHCKSHAWPTQCRARWVPPTTKMAQIKEETNNIYIYIYI